MRIRLGMREIIILSFLLVFVSSLLLLNRFFMSQQQKINDAFTRVKIDSTWSGLSFKTTTDSLLAKQSLQKYKQSLALIDMTLKETKMYSVAFFLVIMVLSGGLFIFLIIKLSRPLIDLKEATYRIRKGDFAVHLPENGLPEIKELQRSFNDMSNELSTTQKKLIVAEKEMIWKDLSRVLAHEIKNPLTPIQLQVQRLEEKFELDKDKFDKIFPESLRIIQQELENLRHVSQDFSSFAKIEMPQQEAFDPADQLEDILSSYQPTYQFDLQIEHGFLVNFDRTHFYQIVTNILQNAIDASPPDGLFTIRLKNDHRHLVLSIEDHGDGIDPEDLPRIFEPYFTRKNRGTGMGLALVKRLLDANQAKVHVRSRIGKGTAFDIIMEEALENTNH